MALFSTEPAIGLFDQYPVRLMVCIITVEDKRRAQQQRRWMDIRPNTFEFSIHSAGLRSYIRSQIYVQLANRCQHLSVFSTTNIPLLWYYIHELTYIEYITTSSLYGKYIVTAIGLSLKGANPSAITTGNYNIKQTNMSSKL